MEISNEDQRAIRIAADTIRKRGYDHPSVKQHYENASKYTIGYQNALSFFVGLTSSGNDILDNHYCSECGQRVWENPS